VHSFIESDLPYLTTMKVVVALSQFCYCYKVAFT